jgi:hypothetical protein
MKNKVWSNLGSIRFATRTEELSKYKAAINNIMAENGMKNPKVALDGCIN